MFQFNQFQNNSTVGIRIDEIVRQAHHVKKLTLDIERLEEGFDFGDDIEYSIEEINIGETVKRSYYAHLLGDFSYTAKFRTLMEQFVEGMANCSLRNSVKCITIDAWRDIGEINLFKAMLKEIGMDDLLKTRVY